MPTATLTSKGQITIPLPLRISLGLHAGSKLDFIREDNGFKVIPVTSAVASSLKGRFAGRTARSVSIADMDEAIASEAVSRHRAVSAKRKPQKI